MSDLQATQVFSDLPVILGRARLDPVQITRATLVQPYPGSDPNPALAALGLCFPAPGQSQTTGAARILWAGREGALLLNAAPPEELHAVAALTDQSDGWAWLRLSGADARAVLARLTALDLRPAQFAIDACARTELGHISAIILRSADDSYDIAVYRSMAHTLRHELETAITHLAARAEV